MKNEKPQFKTKNCIHNTRYALHAKKGFTIIEMLVTISVFTVITSMMLVNYPKFSDRLSLERTAQEIALSLREAKTFAIAVREFGGIFPGYGVHFDLSSGSTKEYMLFVDRPINLSLSLEGNKVYDDDNGGLNDEKIDQFLIQTNVSIKEFCKDFDPVLANCDYKELDIVYFRPDPNVTIKAMHITGLAEDLSVVAIVIETPAGDCKAIIIRVTGQVSVKGCD